MKVDIKATQLELTPKIKEYIQKKMDMVEKYLGDISVIQAKYEIERTTNHHNKGEIYRAEVCLYIPRTCLRVEKTEKDLLKAIDKVKDHLVQSISRHKEKLIDRRRRPVEV